MGRKRSNNEDEEEKPIKRVKEKQEGRESMRPSMIKNKEKRSAVHAKLKQQKKLDKRRKVKAREAAEKKALELGEERVEEEEKRVKEKQEGRESMRPSMIKNKEKRSAVHAKLKQQKKVDKRRKVKAREVAEKKALELGEEPPPKMIPRTIENTRELDETVCLPDDEELFAGNDVDEFSAVLRKERTPKVLITTSRYNSTRGPAFIADLISVIPDAHYYKRGTYNLKKIVKYANEKEFTSVIVVHTNRREPDALLVIGLPDGPTAHFKLSKLMLRKDIKDDITVGAYTKLANSYSLEEYDPRTRNHGKPTSHKPELVLTNFTTRLGHRVGRMIQSLFPQDPEFRGRRVVTFHNQRDFIFFRHHRYIFETKESKQKESKGKKSKDEKNTQERTIARLQECGPRFTLKLISLQHGTFDTKGGEYEWVHKPEMDTSRRRFFL
ncbi:hypothetical protein RND71_025400 [Anisodus tanguticus]|uniref:Brix domain-containing protein n=1 Tax=Anisodus tanguticus TaxID=243964 RepID=A0AAE1RPX3_9SOLA|nr:hypothetical protein RND71_025400 [Anisodus tanguticus]